MKPLLLLFTLCLSSLSFGQQFPVIEGYGGIYEIPEATILPDPDLKYNIIIDLVTASDLPTELSRSLNNVARLLNLHAIGGVPLENLSIVLTIHGGMTTSLLSDMAYQKRFEVDNPNAGLYKKLKEAGVKVTVCGQSLLARNIEADELIDEAEIATSMLTTMTTYQLKGYVPLKF